MARRLPKTIESHPLYARVLYLDETYRVILCPGNIQFILQSKRSSKGQEMWRNRSYCVTKSALERVWVRTTDTPVPAEIAGLADKAHHQDPQDRQGPPK